MCPRTDHMNSNSNSDSPERRENGFWSKMTRPVNSPKYPREAGVAADFNAVGNVDPANDTGV